MWACVCVWAAQRPPRFRPLLASRGPDWRLRDTGGLRGPDPRCPCDTLARERARRPTLVWRLPADVPRSASGSAHKSRQRCRVPEVRDDERVHHRTVRLASIAALLALASCSLYFESDDDGPGAIPVDAPIDGGIPGSCGRYAFCGGDGARYITPPLQASYCPPSDIFERGEPAGQCAGACAIDSQAYPCTSSDCAAELTRVCGPPPSCPETGQLCTQDVRCIESARCGRSAVRATCTCDDAGRYTCIDHTAELRAAMLGPWRGTVYPPPFATQYNVELNFLADGTYWSESPTTTAFYYGEDGGGLGRRWEVLGDAAGGPLVRLDVYFGVFSICTSVLTDVEVRDDRLRFTFWDGWLDCSRPFTFDLRRI